MSSVLGQGPSASRTRRTSTNALVCSVRGTRRSEWPEVVGSVSGSGSGDVKGKGKAVATSPRAGEKKKCVKKSAAKVVNSDIEIVTKPSDVSGSGSGHALCSAWTV